MTEQRKLTMVQAINLALMQEMERDDDVLVLGEDIGVDGGVFRVTDGLLAKFGEQRVIDTPLAEGAIVGMAIGMAGTNQVAKFFDRGATFVWALIAAAGALAQLDRTLRACNCEPKELQIVVGPCDRVVEVGGERRVLLQIAIDPFDRLAEDLVIHQRAADADQVDPVEQHVVCARPGRTAARGRPLAR